MMQPLTPAEAHELARAIGRKLTEADLDAREAVIRDEAQRVLAQRANRVPRVPAGCDQQGRYPMAAEACTELGADDDALAAARGVVWGAIAALMIWCALALVVITVLT